MSIKMGTNRDVSRFIFISACIYLFLSPVSAYYCNHDLCPDDQYCCGDNLCCVYVYSPWYFWAGVVLMILILSACGGLFRYCYDSNSYVILQTSKAEYYSPKENEGKGSSNVVIDCEAPPPYSDTPESNYQRFTFYEQDTPKSSHH